MKNDKIKIIIAEAGSEYITSQVSILKKHKKIHIIDLCLNSDDLIHHQQLHNADLLLIDVEMPCMNGINAAQKINYLFPRIPMIAFADNTENICLSLLIKSGFRGFLRKKDCSAKIYRAFHNVLLNRLDFPLYLKV